MNFNYLPRRGGDKRSGSMVRGQVFFKRKGGGGGWGWNRREEGSGEEWNGSGNKEGSGNKKV